MERFVWCCLILCCFKQKTAYEIRISDWSSDVCSSDLKTTEQRRYQATERATAYKSLTQAMTRDVMAFVASEQPEFQESHKRLTAVLHGQAPDSHGVQQAMLDRFRHAGFTAQEMAKLESAHTDRKSTRLNSSHS